MTRKHFIKLATMLGRIRKMAKTASKDEILQVMQDEIVRFCVESNGNFNSSMFFAKVESVEKN